MKDAYKKIGKVLLFIFFLAWLNYWIYSMISHFNPASNNLGNSKLPLIENTGICDLQKSSCVIELPSGTKFEIEFSPRPVFSNKLTKISLKLMNAIDLPVSVDIDGTEMEMGFNRPELFEKKEIAKGVYEGFFLLPVCNTDHFEWRAIVLFKNKEESLYGVPFYFQVNRN